MRPTLATFDIILIGMYVVFALGVGSFFFRAASRGMTSFFVGERKLPWWLAGTSIVATTFAADTPLAVTGIVATDGISGNWIWWSWAIAHLTAAFFFARMWRRSGVITDAEITELRYSGKPAAILRGVKAVYFGLFINCLTMAWVIAAMVKISTAFFDVEPGWVIVGCVLVSVIYTSLGGFRGVVITDIVQFVLGMGGAIVLAVMAVKQLGGIGKLPAGDAPGDGMLGALAATTTENGRRIEDVISFLPPLDHPTLPPLFFVVLLIAGWWRYAEGNGYIVQRLAACRDEGQAQGASLFFAVTHNALRPWPWILVALASLIVFPRLAGEASESVQASYRTQAGLTQVVTARPASLDIVKGGTLTLHGLPAGCSARIGGQEVALLPGEEAGTTRATFSGFNKSALMDLFIQCPATSTAPPTLRLPPVRVELLDREMGYPLLMGLYLPTGLLGLVIASLLAAFMSTIDTHTNWGASYLVQDLYRRFFRPDEEEKHYVQISRLSILLMALLAGCTALIIHDIASVWRFLVALGAGLGSVTAARWYWARVTPHAEFAALGVTTVLAVGLELFCTKTLFGGPNPLFVFAVAGWAKILIIAAASLCAWIPTALFGPPNDDETLRAFASLVRPLGPGWQGYRDGDSEAMGSSVLSFGAGIVVVFGALFGIGDLIIGHPLRGAILIGVAALLLFGIIAAGRDRDASS